MKEHYVVLLGKQSLLLWLKIAAAAEMILQELENIGGVNVAWLRRGRPNFPRNHEFDVTDEAVPDSTEM